MPVEESAVKLREGLAPNASQSLRKRKPNRRWRQRGGPPKAVSIASHWSPQSRRRERNSQMPLSGLSIQGSPFDPTYQLVFDAVYRLRVVCWRSLQPPQSRGLRQEPRMGKWKLNTGIIDLNLLQPGCKMPISCQKENCPQNSIPQRWVCLTIPAYHLPIRQWNRPDQLQDRMHLIFINFRERQNNTGPHIFNPPWYIPRCALCDRYSVKWNWWKCLSTLRLSEICDYDTGNWKWLKVIKRNALYEELRACWQAWSQVLRLNKIRDRSKSDSPSTSHPSNDATSNNGIHWVCHPTPHIPQSCDVQGSLSIRRGNNNQRRPTEQR